MNKRQVGAMLVLLLRVNHRVTGASAVAADILSTMDMEKRFELTNEEWDQIRPHLELARDLKEKLSDYL